MRERELNRLVVAIALLTPVACKPRATDSEVKHTFGETRRDLPEPQVPCEQRDVTTKYPVADAYIRKLAEHLAAKNPKTLSGAFSLDRLCFTMADTDEFNATASARYMLVALNRPILSYASTDAEVASVLAHELAHVVMRHDVAIHPDVAKLPEVQKLAAAAVAAEAKLQATRAAQEALVEDNRSHFKARRQRLEAAHPNFASAVKRMDELNAEALKLAQKEPFSWGPPSDPLPVSQFSSFDADKLKGEERKRYDEADAEFSRQAAIARDVAFKDHTPAERTTEDGFFDRAMKVTKDLVALSGEASKFRDQIQARTVEVLGVEAAHNWTEAEADEVGYELYLRGGFVEQNFTWILQVVSQIENVSAKPEAEQKYDEGLWSSERALQECLKARKNLEKPILRGGESHPAPCWRLSDIRTKEDKDHEVEYAPLKAVAKTVNLEGTPTLADVKKELKATTAK